MTSAVGGDGADIDHLGRIERHIGNGVAQLVGDHAVYERNAQPGLDHAAGNEAVGRGEAQIRRYAALFKAQAVVGLKPCVCVGARRRVPQRAGHSSGRVRRAAYTRKPVYSASARAFRRAQEKIA